MVIVIIQRKTNYVPRLRTKEELKKEVKYKKTWNGGSLGNGFFQDPSYIRPAVLDEWQMKRVQMPERAYKKFFFRKYLYLKLILHLYSVEQKPFSYGASHTREFGQPDENMLGEHFSEVLQD